MARQRVSRRSRRGSGIKVLERPGYGLQVRWTDPISGKVRQVAASKLGLTSRVAVEAWCAQKAAALAQERQQLLLGGTDVAAPITPADAAAKVIAELRADRTRESRAVILRRLTDYLAERRIMTMQDVTAPALHDWRGKVLRGETPARSPRTRNLWFASVGHFLRRCRRRGWLPRVSTEQIAAVVEAIAVPRKRVVPLSPAEIRRMLAAALRHDEVHGGQLAAVLWTMFATGMRRNEALGLRWSECREAEHRIVLSAERTKVRADRIVTLTETPSVARVLSAMRLRSGGNGLVFDAGRGRLQWWMRRAHRECGLPTITPHDLRRSVSCYLASAPAIYGSASVFRTAERNGHSLDVCRRYYATALPGLSSAATLEGLLGVEDLVDEIVRRAGGAPAEQTAANAAATA